MTKKELNMIENWFEDQDLKKLKEILKHYKIEMAMLENIIKRKEVQKEWEKNDRHINI